jgi:hypothetical protein
MDTHSEQQQHHHNYGNYNKTNQFGQVDFLSFFEHIPIPVCVFLVVAHSSFSL